MIYKITKSKNKCFVSFEGKTLEDYLKFARRISTVRDKEWASSMKAWECAIEACDYINTLLSVNFDVGDMGSTLKLEPYAYQKQLIFDIITHGELLLISPCGSGKTPIGIGAFYELKRNNMISQDGIGVILVKASLKLQWLKEIEKFSDLKANVIKSHASITSSFKKRKDTIKRKIKKLDAIVDKQKIIDLESQIEMITKEESDAFNKQFENYDLLVLNYEALKDTHTADKLKILNIEYIFADEVHKIANHKSQLSATAYQFNYINYKIGATATPISNNPENVYGLYTFIAPSLFPSFKDFAKNYIKYAGFGRVAGSKNENHLVSKYANNIVVLTKNDVAKHLPKLSVVQQYCEMTDEQAEMSAKIMSELQEAKDEEYQLSNNIKDPRMLENNEKYQSITARIMMLQTFAQELCNDPRLLAASQSEYAAKYLPHNLKSPKTELMLELVSSIIDSGEKVIIISRWVTMLKIIKADLEKTFPGVLIAEINGSMTDKERYDNMYIKFRDNKDYKILLMSDAGSTGTNASTTQYIIEFDLAESYATQTQRHGRIERADSIHDNVFVYQLIANNSYDEIQQMIVNKKERYDNELIKVFSNKEE